MIRSLAAAALLGLATTLAGAARAESSAAGHSAWQSCLQDAFALNAELSSPMLAADSALRDCRERETAYLATLATSPLVDSEDVARIRPALVARARLRLLGNGRSRQL